MGRTIGKIRKTMPKPRETRLHRRVGGMDEIPRHPVPLPTFLRREKEWENHIVKWVKGVPVEETTRRMSVETILKKLPVVELQKIVA